MSFATTNPIYKIFDAVAAEKITHKKNTILRANQSVPLKRLCRIIGDSDISFLLPPGTPEYKPMSPPDGYELALYSRVREMYLFINDTRSANLSEAKRQQKFINLLENIHPRDAEWLIRIKDRDYPNGFTMTMMKNAFKDLFDVAL